MRLVVSAIGVIVLVILGTDPLSNATPLSTSWPDPALFYQLIPVSLIDFLAMFTVGTALVSVIVVLARSGRGPEFEAVVGPALSAAAAAVVIAVPGLMMLAHVSLSSTVFAVTTVLAAALIWRAAATASRRGLADNHRAGVQDRRRQLGRPGWYEPDDEPDHLREHLEPADDYLDRGYRAEPARYGVRGSGAGQRFGESDSDISYPALAALAAEPPDRDRYDSREFDGFSPGYDEYDDSLAMSDGQRTRLADGDDPPAHLFGQITIYTLLDDRLEEFDRMTERVVEEVRSREPGTLVYIVHAVPTAPMQRILYEVYRDRAAYDEHLAQPYVSRYVAARQSMVLATNAIELGLQQAKVTPLPSYSAISDILSESGIDLTGVTRSARGAGAFQGDQRRRSEPPDLPMDSRGEPHPDPLVDPRFGSRRYEP